METKSATVTIESNKYYRFADAYADSASSAIFALIKKAQDAQNAILVANAFKVKNVIFNPPATIVFWVDGTKTVVKAQNETFDPEKGLAMAFARKALGNKHSYYDTIKRYTKKHVVKNKETANGNP